MFDTSIKMLFVIRANFTNPVLLYNSFSIKLQTVHEKNNRNQTPITFVMKNF